MLRLKDKLVGSWDRSADWMTRRWSHVLIPLLVSIGCAFFVENPFQTALPGLKVGEISSADFKAPSRIVVVDDELTAARKAAAEKDVSPVFDYDSQARTTTAARIKMAFDSGRRGSESRENFESLLRVTIEKSEWHLIKQNGFNSSVESALSVLLENIFRNYFVVGEGFEIPAAAKEVVVRDLFSEIEERIPRDRFAERLLNPIALENKLEDLSKSNHRVFADVSRPMKKELVGITTKILNTNLTFNPVETENRQKQSREKTEKVIVEIEKGEMIVREGQKIDRRHLLLADALRSQGTQQASTAQFAGFAALLFCLMFIFHWVGVRNFRKFRLSTRDRLVLGSYFFLCIAFLSGLQFLSDAVVTHQKDGILIQGLMPLAFVGMTLRLFTSMEICTFFCVLLSICIGWLMKEPYVSVVFLSVSLAGAAAMRHINQRLDVVKAGLFAGAVQCCLVLLGAILGLVPSAGFDNIWINLGMTAIFALASGLLSASIVLVTQPMIEFLGYTTDLRLMELSNTNHPLLKELIMNAPGSYYHSFVVSQLAEKAAEAINANPLFARVAALYHDVGKLGKPNYFIENIQGENKHDKLMPTMSALIISNHVKEGIEIAHRHQLPQSIVEVIPQHHGTALISYFYEKAKKLAAHPDEVDEKEFRYPGPKPQTKEAAIIMCADAVEATVKSLGNVSIDQLRQKVSATIRRFFLDGQLDECDLSLKDLNGIGNAFVNVLQGIYHQRIEYPHLKEQEKKSADGEENTSSITSKTIR